MKRSIALVVAGLLLSSCAPLMLLRTPKPVEAGQTRIGMSFGYGVQITQLPQCVEDPQQPRSCFVGGSIFGVPFEPISVPIQIDIAQGMGNGGELDWTIQLGFLPGLRLGYKQLLLDGPIRLAIDGGGSLYMVNGGLDLGLLVSFPLEEWEPYFALRGFYTSGWGTNLSQNLVTGAVTLGASDKGAFLEVTLASQSVKALWGGQGVPSIGWILVPAIGFRF